MYSVIPASSSLAFSLGDLYLFRFFKKSSEVIGTGGIFGSIPFDIKYSSTTALNLSLKFSVPVVSL